MFRWLMTWLTNSDRGLVRWTDEAGSNRGLLTAARFTEEFSNALREALPGLQIHVVQDLEIKIVDLNGKASRGFLENAYNLFKLAPENKREIMEKFVTAMAEEKSSNDDLVDRTRIVPIIKDKDWPHDVNANCKNGEGERSLELYYEDYNEELIVMYAEDTPKNTRYLSLACLTAQNLELKDLRQTACQNLDRILPQPRIEARNGVYRISAGGDYDASLLLLDSIWNGSKFEVPGETVVAIPSRAFLFVTGSKDAQGLARVKTIVQDITRHQPYRLTSKLFVYRQGTFVVFDD